MSSKKAITIVLVLLSVAVGVVALEQGSIVLNYSGMDEYVGKTLSARIVDLATGREVERTIIPEIAEGSFTIDFGSLAAGNAYRIDFYVDMNGNGRYDQPPVDQAWQLELQELSDAVSLEFRPTTDYTDIDWPPMIDGVIEPHEYRHSMTDPGTGMEVHWQNDATYLYVGLVSPGTGWEAIGFDPTRKMQGANIIIGAVSEDSLVIEDHYGASPTSHREDKASQILQSAGVEAEGKTVIEFVIPLASDDPNDVSLVPGTDVTVILAYHVASDRLTARHTKRSTSSIALDGGGE